MASQWTIRRYEPDDIDELLDVWYRASRLAHPFLSEEFFAEERVMIAEQWMPKVDATVCTIDERVVGFVSLIGNEVGGFFVDPDLHGRGIGRALMDNVRAKHPILELAVLEENVIGRRFYDAYGFEFVERRRSHQPGHHELWLRLAGTT